MKSVLRLLCYAGFVLCFMVGCSEDSAPAGPTAEESTSSALVPATGPAIMASPNPVTGRSSAAGTTVVAWNSGESEGEVRLTTNGTDERLFAQGQMGSQEAAWIAAGTTYEFRLYGDDKTKMLASVKVTRGR
jgi:hypothetical protein